MSLAFWNPVNIFTGFDDHGVPASLTRFKDDSRRHYSPRFEITENEKQFRLTVDVPGMKPEDLKIKLEDYGSQTQEQRDAVQKAKVGKSDEVIFLHIPYYPPNPSSGFEQNIWRNLVLSPPGKENLNQLTNWEGHHVPIKRFIAAFHRNPNLANLNSYRKLSLHTGLKPSTFIT